jgi:phospholipase/carboxylesterase
MDAPDRNLDRALKAEINLYYDFEPAPQTKAPLLIALHGYGANKRQMMKESRQIAPENFAIATLQGFHQHIREPKEPGGPLRFGFGWLTNFKSEESVAVHHQALRDLIAALVANDRIDPNRIFVLGFSQSCALNYRFAFTYPELLRGVIGIAGGLPGDWDTSKLYQSANFGVFHLAGANEEIYPPERCQNYAAQLRTRARDVQFKTYDAGHEIIQTMRDDIKQWLVDHDAH